MVHINFSFCFFIIESWKDLEVKYARTIIRKGYRKQIDSYSGFFENDRVTKIEKDVASRPNS